MSRNILGKHKFIECDCSAHVLGIQFDEDDKIVYFSYYGILPHNVPLWQRMRCAYAELKGDAWKDNLVFKKEQIVEIRDFLNELLEDIK
jgi:hypothetical protein